MSDKTVERLRDIGTGRRDMLNIPPDKILVEPGHNPRDYSLPDVQAHVAWLKESIREIGVQQPLLVRWEAATKTAYLVGGECRLRAVRELIAEGIEIASVPCIQVQAQNEAERVLLALVENSGKPLSQLEAAGAYKRLLRFGWDKAQIASKCAVSLHHVTRSLELLDVPEEVKHQVSIGAVTPAVAVKAVREHGSKAGPVLAERIAEANGKVVKRERMTLPAKSTVSSAARKLLKEVTPADWEAQDEFISISYAALAELKTALEA